MRKVPYGLLFNCTISKVRLTLQLCMKAINFVSSKNKTKFTLLRFFCKVPHNLPFYFHCLPIYKGIGGVRIANDLIHI